MASYAAYNRTSSAYKLDREQRRSSRIEVIPGGAREQGVRSASDTAVMFAKALIAMIMAFALIGVVRITLSSATVSAALEAKQIDRDIDVARDEGSRLEVLQSTLSNPTRIKQEAATIGMVTPTDMTFLDMSGDIVITDAAGALSLSGSVEAMSAA